jgi:hypothetical protein
VIISASYKTDIPAFYGEWFMARLRAGHCRMVNPYGGQVYRVPLDIGAVDGFVFWTRNLGPFLGHLSEVSDGGYPFVVHQTITGYPRALDVSTIGAARAVDHLRRVGRRFGPRVPVWRYDPVVATSLTPPDWHRRNFAELARGLAGVVDEVVVSFAQIYRKTARNMDRAAGARGFAWNDPEAEEKRHLLAAFADTAATHGMTLSLCGQPQLMAGGGVEARCIEARCIDARRLGDAAGRPIAAQAKPHRKTCACVASRDIGAYDTCPHGCVYCYAVESHDRAKGRHRQHDPGGDYLFPPAARQLANGAAD